MSNVSGTTEKEKEIPSIITQLENQAHGILGELAILQDRLKSVTRSNIELNTPGRLVEDKNIDTPILTDMGTRLNIILTTLNHSVKTARNLNFLIEL